ncbi:P2X purinoceptor 7 [Lampris incognitus]|uniref:P2X purinoceptor 7 n=1 Tax=Lampris incognitus TaxID=2546036 RepID=UPI0024B51430|nr:P2X purinoceptor 7 [Lampris incognitus]
MSSKLFNLCQYETNKLVRIRSVRLGSLKWTLNGLILMFICVMLLWNKTYQDFDLVVSSVTSKVKGVALASLPGVGPLVWDHVDYSPTPQGRNSFFVVTNVIVTQNQKQGKCPEVLPYGKVCETNKDCEVGASTQHSHGIQTGSCVKSGFRKTCEVSAWCPIETKRNPPRPALLAAAENFTVLIKNNIRFPAFNFIRRNILPWMNDSYLSHCQRRTDPLCPIFRLGDIVKEAKEDFSKMAVEGGVIAIQIKWDCNLDRWFQRCLPKYSFRRLDEKESNRTLYPGLNFRFAKYHTQNGVEGRTLYKAFGIRFDIMVFGQAGRFSFIQLIIYIGSTLSYYALTTVFIDWLIGTSCYSVESRQNYSERKVESVQDKQQCILSVSYVDEPHIRLVKRSQKKSLQLVKPMAVQQHQEDTGHLTAMLGALQQRNPQDEPPKPASDPGPDPQPTPGSGSSTGSGSNTGSGSGLSEDSGPARPAWCVCGNCKSSSHPQEELCCRHSDGPCITSSPLFEQLVLRRSLLDTVLLYRDPFIGQPTEGMQTAALRHCAYEQYIRWRFGVPPLDTHPAIPSCCVRRIRAEYPSLDGQYSGFRLGGVVSMQACSNGRL